MSVASIDTPPDLSASAARSADLFFNSLGVETDIYCWGTEWSLVLDRGTTSKSHELRNELCKIHQECTEPVVAWLHDVGHLLIPFSDRDERFLAVATMPEFGVEPLHLVGKLTQQNVTIQIQQQANKKQYATPDSGNKNPTCDTEASSNFLPYLIQTLSELESDYNFSDIADAVLPTLSSAIAAQSLGIVPNSTSSRKNFFSVGDHVGDLAEWERIVKAHWKPNDVDSACQSLDGVAYPSIRNFVIEPIQMGEHLFGWLVADIDELDSEFDEKAATASAIMRSTANVIATYAFADERLKHKEQLLLDVVRSLVSAIDAKDPQTCGHSVRVAIYASVVAEGLELTTQECEEVYLSGLLHDVGKIGVPESIFHKSTPLTEEEFDLVKRHPDHGWKILHRLEDLQHILPGVVHHHESYDGSGYPDQIAGEDIPLVARILAAVDAYDALTSDRPYRKGKSHMEAMAVLDEGSGVQWDPIVVETLHEISRRIERVSKKYRREAHPWRIPGSITAQDDLQAATPESAQESVSDSTTETTSRYDAWGVDRI